MVSGYLEFKKDEETTHNPLHSTEWESQNWEPRAQIGKGVFPHFPLQHDQVKLLGTRCPPPTHTPVIDEVRITGQR